MRSASAKSRWASAAVVAVLAGTAAASSAGEREAKPVPTPGKSSGLEAFVPQVGHVVEVTEMAFADGGERLVTASSHDDGTVKVWDVASGAIVRHLDGEQSVDISADGTFVAARTRHGELRVWKASDGSLEKTFDAAGPLAFVPGQDLLVAEVEGPRRAPGLLQVWKVGSWKKVRTLSGHSSGITDIAFGRGGRSMATGSYYGNIKLWDMEKGELVRTLRKLEKPVAAVALSPDGKRVAVAYRGASDVHLWNVSSGQALGQLEVSKKKSAAAITAMQWLPGADDDKGVGRLVVSAREGSTRIWDISKKRVVRTLERGGALAVSADGARLAVADRTIDIFSTESGKRTARLSGHDDAMDEVAFTADGAHLATSALDGRAEWWKLSSGAMRRAHRWPDPRKKDGSWTGQYRLSREGQWVAWHPWYRTEAPAKEPEPTKLYAMEDGEKRHEIAPRGGGVVELLFAPGDERVVTREPTSGGKKTIVSIWEIAGTKLLETIKVPGWYSLAEYVADGSSLVLFDESSQRARARLWQKETGLLMPLSLGALDARYHTEEFYAGPNLRLAFADDEDHIKIWDAKDKKIVADFGAQPHRVRRIAVSPDGSRLASLDASGDVRIFDIASKKMLLEWPEHTLLRASEMAFDPKGAYLAITRQGWVEVLEIESGKWRAIYRRGDGWMQYDSEGKVRCEKEGCALVGFRTPKGEIVGHRDRRARKLRGLSKF